MLYFYLVASKDYLNLRIENDNDVLEWVNVDDVVNKLSYDNLKVFFEQIKNIVYKNINK